MSDPLRFAFAFALAAALSFALTPVARRLALRTGFLDHPAGYKGHAASTPYLGGAAVVVAAVIASVAFAPDGDGLGLLIGCVLVMHVVGTVDDRMQLGVGLRMATQIGIAIALYAGDLGWTVFGSDVLDMALTIFWVVGIVNAFNLIDNLDGAAAALALSSSVAIGVLAGLENVVAIGAIAFALAGACAGFLPYNLARPARIFLGDGGSMPIGVTVAALVMAIPEAGEPYYALLALAPLVGVPILDTTLVVVSRHRRGVNVLSGARDHLTHRLERLVGNPRAVALSLATAQIALGGVGIALYQVSEVTILAASAAYLVIGLVTLRLLETAEWASPHGNLGDTRGEGAP